MVGLDSGKLGFGKFSYRNLLPASIIHSRDEQDKPTVGNCLSPADVNTSKLGTVHGEGSNLEFALANNAERRNWPKNKGIKLLHEEWPLQSIVRRLATKFEPRVLLLSFSEEIVTGGVRICDCLNVFGCLAELATIFNIKEFVLQEYDRLFGKTVGRQYGGGDLCRSN